MAINPTFKVTGTEAKGLLYGLLAMDIQQLRDNPQWLEPSLHDRIASGEVKYRQRDEEEHWKTIREMLEEIDSDGVSHSDCEDLACWLAAERRVKDKVQSHPFAYSPKDGLFHVVTADPVGSSSYGRQASERWPGALMAPGVKGYELRDPSAKAGMPTTHVEGYGALRGKEDMQEEYGKIGDVTRAFGEGLGLGAGGVSSIARAIGEGVREAVDIPSAHDAGKLVGEMVADGLFPTLAGPAIDGGDEDLDEELLAMEDIDLLEDDMEDYGTLSGPLVNEWLFDDPEHDILLAEIAEAIEDEDEMAADEGLGEEFGAFNVMKATSQARSSAMAGKKKAILSRQKTTRTSTSGSSSSTSTGTNLGTGSIARKIAKKRAKKAHKAQVKRRTIRRRTRKAEARSQSSSRRRQHSQRAGQRSGGSRGSTQSGGGQNVIIRHVSTQELEPQVICVDEEGYEVDCPPENGGYDQSYEYDQGYDDGGQGDYYEDQYGKLFEGKILGGVRVGRGLSRVFTPDTAFDQLIEDAKRNLDKGQEDIAKRMMGKAVRTMAKLERKDSSWQPSSEAREMLRWFRGGATPGSSSSQMSSSQQVSSSTGGGQGRRRRPGPNSRRKPGNRPPNGSPAYQRIMARRGAQQGQGQQGPGQRRGPGQRGQFRRGQQGQGQQGPGQRRGLGQQGPGQRHGQQGQGQGQGIQRGPRSTQNLLRVSDGQLQRPERHGPQRFQRPSGPGAQTAPMASGLPDDYGYIDRDDLFDMDEAVFAGVSEFMGDDE